MAGNPRKSSRRAGILGRAGIPGPAGILGPAATRAGRTNAALTQWVGAAFTLLRLRAGD